MRRLVSVPAAVLLSLLITSTALASFCGNESKPEGAGQHTVLWIAFTAAGPPTVTILEGGNANGKVTGGFVDVHLDFDDDGTADCVINDTYFMSEHREFFFVAPGQAFELGPGEVLAVLPAVHRGNHPDGNPGSDTTGAGFAEAVGAGC